MARQIAVEYHQATGDTLAQGGFLISASGAKVDVGAYPPNVRGHVHAQLSVSRKQAAQLQANPRYWFDFGAGDAAASNVQSAPPPSRFAISSGLMVHTRCDKLS